MIIDMAQTAGPVAVTIFNIQGDIDASTYEELERQASKAFQAGMQNLILDLSRVDYISSAGVRALNNIFRLLQSSKAESDQLVYQGVRAGTYKSPHLKLVNPKPAVANVLSVTGLDMFLEIHRDQRAAVTSFKSD
jgi:anti-anti-sigma factor